MFEWKVEEMKFMNNCHGIYIKRNRMEITTYACESSVSREDKIAFVDSMQDGKLSYILSLIEKFNKDKESLPKKDIIFRDPEVKTTSLKAWVRRNDTKYPQKIIDDWFKYGKYNIEKKSEDSIEGLFHGEGNMVKLRIKCKKCNRFMWYSSILGKFCPICNLIK